MRHFFAFASKTVLFLLAGAATAFADTAVFNFNSLADDATDTQVRNYMNGVLLSALGAGNTVTLTGAAGERTYTGDDHVVGPFVSTGVIHSLTLGNTEGATVGGAPWVEGARDTFLRNLSGTDRITMQFVGFEIASVSFDYEIFPNSTCTDLTATACGGWNADHTDFRNRPDFTFRADGVQIFRYVGVGPGTGGTYPESAYTDSRTGTEKSPQKLGTTGTITFATPVTKLEFIDWPVMIGIDNLTVTTHTPEPASILLFGSAVVGFLVLRLKRRRP